MTRRSPTGWWLVAPAVAAMGATVAVTGKGLYVSPDAVFYVGTARNLVGGRGFTPPAGLPPIGHFPPLFPLVLALLGRMPGVDPLTAARLVNVAAVGGVVVLVGWVVRRTTGSVPAALVASVLTTAAVDLLTLSASALSEPLFILLAVAGVAVLAVHLDGDRSTRSLLGAAALVAAAFLTRYAGAALVLAGGAALVRFGRARRWHGAFDAGMFCVLTVAPVLGFLAWAGRAAGAGADRSVAWHAFGLDYLGQAARPLARWTLPWPRPPIGLGLAVLVVAIGVMVVRREPWSTLRVVSTLPWLLGAFSAAYLAVVVANRLVTDASGRLDARFLAPLHVVAIVAAVPWLHRRIRPGPMGCLAVALVVAQAAGAAAWTVRGVTDDGIARPGYDAAAWRASPVVAGIAATDPSVPVYSNAFDAVAFLTDRSATPVPAKTEYVTGRVNPDYAAQLAAMQADLARSGGYLAYFDASTFRRSFLPSRAELEQALPLEIVASDSVGTLYQLRPPNR